MTAENVSWDDLDVSELQNAQALYDRAVTARQDFAGLPQQQDWGGAELQVLIQDPLLFLLWAMLFLNRTFYTLIYLIPGVMLQDVFHRTRAAASESSDGIAKR